ncbi:UNVERIFIED_CONTAM: hypothetical protein GTU68_052977 [Idotea baltica]|nr:hypothetical protein [Idotea baltica]
METITEQIAIQINGELKPEYNDILTDEALVFLAELHNNFNERRKALLVKREERQAIIDGGELPNFLPETKSVRDGNWKVAPLPADLLDRRVEITGPVDRKMIINALNSGAKVFMADFEDSNTPSWGNNMNGQVNLRDANLGTISFYNQKKDKTYQLNSKTAVLMVRPRGFHLEEKNLQFNGENGSGSLIDFGLYFFHNIKALMAKGSATYFYLPKMESHLEARLWNDVFIYAQTYLGVPQGTIKATVLIETILASFELNEILYELRQHSAGLNCGRWDYIFSYIKKLRNLKGYVLPDRGKVTMQSPFMKTYSELVVKTCHKRGVHAMGGMAAFIPIKNDEEANQAAIEKVRQDKINEAKNGHDGTWVAHPGLVKTAMDVFNEYMPAANQIAKQRNDIKENAEALIEPVTGTITEAGVRKNINVGILYIESWLRGNGAAAIYNLMEDAATAEISRTQVWQWIHTASELEDGRTVTYKLYETLKLDEIEKIKAYVGLANYENGRFEEAINLFDALIKSENYTEFLTLPAYELL